MVLMCLCHSFQWLNILTLYINTSSIKVSYYHIIYVLTNVFLYISVENGPSVRTWSGSASWLTPARWQQYQTFFFATDWWEISWSVFPRKSLQPGLIFVGKTRSLPLREVYVSCSTRFASGLAYKY